jgi:hypothetical protein
MDALTHADEDAVDAGMWTIQIGRSKNKLWAGDPREFCAYREKTQARIVKRLCGHLVDPSTPRYSGAECIAALHRRWVDDIPDDLELTPCAAKLLDIIKVAHDAVTRSTTYHVAFRGRALARTDAAEAYSTAMLHVIAAHRAKAECGCCYDALDLGEIAVTSCGHVFCGGCLDKWRKREVKNNRDAVSCPMCRAALPLDNMATSLKAADVELFLKLDARDGKRPREEQAGEQAEEPPLKAAARVVIELE